jgi:hypothetical protein
VSGITEVEPKMITLIWLMSCVFISGFLFGKGHERKRSDRKLAAIVAERLLRKPEVSSSSDTQTNAGFNQQLAAMANSSQGGLANMLGSSGIGSSQGLANSILGGPKIEHFDIFGSNPDVHIGVPSKFADRIR